MEKIIKVKNVSKKFRLYYDRPLSLKERVVTGSKGVYKEFYALDDISFDVEKGTTLGLLGQNGCGKSTLLKIINRTMFPEKGSVEIKGKVASLIELGAGFHPELSGRENIYTNASVFGISREEIEKRIPEIIRFSELEEFIDNPIRTYSSGMYARLAFSVAISVDADILLVDEILGVGDMNFQAKCAKKIYDMRKNGTTIVLVTHDMGTIDRLCDYAIWLDHGKLMAEGDPKYMQEKYKAFMAEKQELRLSQEDKERNQLDEIKEEIIIKDNMISADVGEEKFELFNFKLLNEKGHDKRSFEIGDMFELTFNYSNSFKEIKPNFGIKITSYDGTLVYGTNTVREGIKNIKLGSEGIIKYSFPAVNLIAGTYLIDIGTTDESEAIRYNSYKGIVEFKMYSAVNDIGVSRIEHVLYIDNKKK